MGGFGGEFLQGFAGSYAREHRDRLERNLAQRGQLADLGLRALEGARPESQLKIITNLGRLVSADPGKKIDKDLMDIGTWLAPPEGYGQQPETPGPQSFTTGSEQVPQGAGMGTQAAPPPSLRGGGMAAVPGVGGGGASMGRALAPPPDSLAPQYRMTSQETGEPLAGTGPFAAPAPPAYSPWYSPEEKSQMASAAEAQSTTTKTRAEREELKRQGEELGLKGADLAAYMGGRAPLVARLQTKDFVNKQGGTVRLSFNNLTNQYFDNDGNEVDISDLQPLNYSSSATTPFKAYWQTGLQSGKDPKALIDEWNTTHRDTSRVILVPQPDGSIIPFETTQESTSTRGGAAAAEPPAPLRTTVAQKGGAVGGRAPAPVTRAFENYNSAIERYNVMEDAYPKALRGDQQAMLNLLANHIGMTMGLQKGARITQAMYDEALQSSPVLAKFAARFDSNGDFSLNPADYRGGVILTEDQMRQMIDLAKVRRDQDGESYKRIQQENAAGYKPPPATGAGKTIKMRAPNGGPIKEVPADQVEHYKSLGAVVVQ